MAVNGHRRRPNRTQEVAGSSPASSTNETAPNGAVSSFLAPTIRHCHKWPGLTEVHWNMQSLREAYLANSVSLVTFEWDGAIGRPSPYDGWVMRTSKRRRP